MTEAKNTDTQTDTQTPQTTDTFTDQLSFPTDTTNSITNENKVAVQLPPRKSVSSDESKYYSVLEIEGTPPRDSDVIKPSCNDIVNASSDEAQNHPISNKSSGGSGSSNNSQNRKDFHEAMEKTVQIRKKMESKRSWKSSPREDDPPTTQPSMSSQRYPPSVPERSARDRRDYSTRLDFRDPKLENRRTDSRSRGRIGDDQFHDFKSEYGSYNDRQSRENYNKDNRSSDDYKPRQSGDYRPRQSVDYRPRQSDDYKPRQSDDYKPRQSDDYKPRQSDDYRPRQSGDYRPRQSDDYRLRTEYDERPYSSYYNRKQSDNFKNRRPPPPPPLHPQIPERYDKSSLRNSRPFSSVRGRPSRQSVRSCGHSRTRSYGGEGSNEPGPRDLRCISEGSYLPSTRDRSAPPHKFRVRNQLDYSGPSSTLFRKSSTLPQKSSSLPRTSSHSSDQPRPISSRSRSQPSSAPRVRVSFANDHEARSNSGSRSLEHGLHQVNWSCNGGRSKTLPRRMPSSGSERSKTLPRRMPSFQSSSQNYPSTRQDDDYDIQCGNQKEERVGSRNPDDLRPLNYGDYLENSYRSSGRFKRKSNYSSRSFKNFTFYNL